MHIDSIVKGGASEIEVHCSGKLMTFKSDIILIMNNSILITPIKVNDQTIGFTDQCTLNFLYYYEDKLYVWNNITVKLIKYGNDIYHKFDLIGEGKQINRREAYRVYIGEDMPLYVNTASGPSAISVLIKDISETGFGFVSKEDFDVERTVRLKLKDNNIIMNLSGVIVRKEHLEHLGSNLYGCKFIEKTPNLSKYLTKRQGELLKKKATTSSIPSSKTKGAKSKIEEFV